MRLAVLTTLCGIFLSVPPISARDRLQLVGSEAVSSFSIALSEEFSRHRGFPTPQVLVTGNGGGFKLFCNGIGREFPDFVGSTRTITDDELAECRTNGVRNVTEILIGYKALVVATPKASNLRALTTSQLYRALAQQLWVDGNLRENPYRAWSDISPGLPRDEVRIIAPAAPSELRDSVVFSMVAGPCEADPNMAGLPSEERLIACSRLRLDRHLIEVRDTAEELALLQESSPNTLGVLWLTDWLRYRRTLPALAIDGVEPSTESIRDGLYAFALPIFVYSKNQHYESVPGLLQFVDELTSQEAMGSDGYLVDEGLIPLTETERRAQRANAIGLNPLWR